MTTTIPASRTLLGRWTIPVLRHNDAFFEHMSNIFPLTYLARALLLYLHSVLTYPA